MGGVGRGRGRKLFCSPFLESGIFLLKNPCCSARRPAQHSKKGLQNMEDKEWKGKKSRCKRDFFFDGFLFEGFGEALEGFGVILGECREDFAVDDIAGLLESANELRV
ncbi:MAG: hypothetical protein Athens041674_233 [Parcubacteria group bacterium Athens0416_74]|nr:MAG: hypothetical protein Athens041674_233 [Parcubacteria group bacterium Athens0416_74]